MTEIPIFARPTGGGAMAAYRFEGNDVIAHRRGDESSDATNRTGALDCRSHLSPGRRGRVQAPARRAAFRRTTAYRPATMMAAPAFHSRAHSTVPRRSPPSC